MKKKNVALVFGITSNYVFALANTLIGLVNNNKKFWDDIIVYYDEMNEQDIEDINKIVKCNFICAKDLKFASDLPKELLSQYSIATFYRYECFNLLKDYHKVIWNDVDILIEGDISGLCKYANKSGFCLTLNNGGFNVEANFKKLIPEYNMFTLLYNAGIMVISDIIPKYEDAYDWLISATCKYADILRWGDQGILNLFIQEFNIEVEEIDIIKYCCHPSLVDKYDDISIVHAYGEEKFWNSNKLKNKFPNWVANNKKWEEISLSKRNEQCPLVSCVMSIYDRMDYADEAISSILNQTYDNLELIIVVEKSENQKKIVNQLKNYSDSRLVIIENKEKLGFPKSLNIGIKKAKGKYIARMDDDDISMPDRFAKQVNYMENNPNVGICGTNAQFFGACNDIIGCETDSDLLKIISLFRTPFVHPTVMMNKDLLLENNLLYSSDYFSEDYELWSRAVKYFDFGNIDEILLNYRAGNVKLTSASNENKIHFSHKKTMANQFENYLNLELTDNELEVIQERKNVFAVCFNQEETMDLRRKTYDKIISRNKEIGFYNQEKLEKYLLKSGYIKTFNHKQNIIKRAIKFVLKPVYSRLMNRVNDAICNNNADIYSYIDKKSKDILSEVKRNEK